MRRITVLQAKPRMVLADDVRTRDGKLLLKKGTVLTTRIIKKIIECGIPTLFIEESSLSFSEEFTDAVRERADKIAENNLEFPDAISLELRTEAENVIKEIMEITKTGRLFDITKARKIVNEIVEAVIKNDNIVAKLADIRILDDYTFAHSVNVCVLSVSCGMVIGYPKIMLKEIGIGAFLHDIGKALINSEILEKPTKLTDNEFEEIKRHCIKGYKFLRDNFDLSSRAARIALQHHERFNGCGYPRGIKGSEIHEYSQIVAIADVYDAITANRIYKNAVLPYEAVESIIIAGGFHFNPKLVKAFVQNLSIYPIGSVVELNTGECGIVTNVNRSLPIRPVVMLVADREGRQLKKPYELDLMKVSKVYVKQVLRFENANVFGPVCATRET